MAGSAQAGRRHVLALGVAVVIALSGTLVAAAPADASGTGG